MHLPYMAQAIDCGKISLDATLSGISWYVHHVLRDDGLCSRTVRLGVTIQHDAELEPHMGKLVHADQKRIPEPEVVTLIGQLRLLAG